MSNLKRNKLAKAKNQRKQVKLVKKAKAIKRFSPIARPQRFQGVF
jgi:hypothetical protein